MGRVECRMSSVECRVSKRGTPSTCAQPTVQGSTPATFPVLTGAIAGDGLMARRAALSLRSVAPESNRRTEEPKNRGNGEPGVGGDGNGCHSPVPNPQSKRHDRSPCADDAGVDADGVGD